MNKLELALLSKLAVTIISLAMGFVFLDLSVTFENQSLVFHSQLAANLSFGLLLGFLVSWGIATLFGFRIFNRGVAKQLEIEP